VVPAAAFRLKRQVGGEHAQKAPCLLVLALICKMQAMLGTLLDLLDDAAHYVTLPIPD